MDNLYFTNLNLSLSESTHTDIVKKVESLPEFKVFTKYYNTPNEVITSLEPYWITINESKFSILENSHVYFAEELDLLIKNLNTLTEINPKDFKLCKTEGHIKRHTDHGRLTSINYYISTRGESIEFDFDKFVPKVNQTFALNVQKPHLINALDLQPRFFFSAWVQKNYESLPL